MSTGLTRFIEHHLFDYGRICVGIAVLLMSVDASAQTGAPIPRDSPTPIALPDRSAEIFRWTDLLDKLALDARTLPDETLRSEALYSVADAYWELSQDRSKELFSSALELALSIESEKTRHAAVTSVISAAAKRDPQLAKVLTKLLLDRKNRNDAALKASIDLLDFDTKTSEAIALASSTVGASSDSAWLIFQLQKRDQESADRVYSAYLNNENSRSLSRLLWLAGYPFGYGEGFGGATDPIHFAGFSGFDFGALRVNRTLAIAFLNIADQSVTSTLNLASGAPPEEGEALTSLVFFTVTYLLEEAKKYRPDLHTRWASLQNDTSQRINPNHREAILSKLRNVLADRDRVRNRTTDEEHSSEEILQEAEKLNSSCHRDVIYAKAAFQLSYKADFKRAMLVADKISAIGLRSNVIQFVYYDMTVAGTASGSSITIDDALRYANRVESPELRALLLVKLGGFVLKNGNQGHSKQLLLDAGKLADRVERPSARASVLLAIEQQLSESDAENRFKLLKDAVSAVNRAKEIKIDRLSMQRRVNFGCEEDKPVWYGESIAQFNLINSLLRFSQSHEDDALQLALDLDPGVNRIRALAAVAGSAGKRIIAERDAKRRKIPANDLK